MGVRCEAPHSLLTRPIAKLSTARLHPFKTLRVANYRWPKISAGLIIGIFRKRLIRLIGHSLIVPIGPELIKPELISALGRQSADNRPTIGRLLADNWPTLHSASSELSGI